MKHRGILLAPFAAALFTLTGCGAGSSGRDVDSSRPTFARDVAPIVFEHCAPCHRPGEAAPFSLLSYDDANSRANQIAEVTASRYMPPWPPEPGHNRFEGERLLSEQQIRTLQGWAEAGAPQGDPGDLPPPPRFIEGWRLGEPDLVIEMPEPYLMPADGIDVYRNFVIPIPVQRPRWVKALELRPGDNRLVHHAFMLVDRTPASRELDAQDAAPGFDGMDTGPGAQSPDGHFISWQPGKSPSRAPEGMAWRLNPGTDLVLQLHMQPSGKTESIQAKVGLFFTDDPPTRIPFKLVLRSIDIDIPAGESQYVIEDEYRLPVDVDMLAVIPHAHYLGKQLEGNARLPSGEEKSLILIRDWDFNWQGDYRCVEPVFLPQGTVVSMRYSYDNSAANIRNPNQPPQRVRYGLQSTDEMGELWLQLLPRRASDLAVLRRDYARKVIEEIVRRGEKALREDPNDPQAHVDLGTAALGFGRFADAERHFRAAVVAEPESVEAHYYLGHVLLRTGKIEEAQRELTEAIRIFPRYFNAHHDLGMLHLGRGELDLAAAAFGQSIEIDPYHAVAHNNLGLVLLRDGNPREAMTHFERSLEIRPDSPTTEQYLRRARAMLGLSP